MTERQMWELIIMYAKEITDAGYGFIRFTRKWRGIGEEEEDG